MLLGYIWLLGTFANSSCDKKINLNIVQNCCRNLAVRALNSVTMLALPDFWMKLPTEYLFLLSMQFYKPLNVLFFF